LNKKLKKGLTTTMAAAMGLGVVIPAVPVIAAPATSGWVLTAQGWTYYKSGVKATGWVLDGGKWYLLDSNGVMKTGWAKDAGTWYFLNASGAMATGWVKDTDGKWYFLKTSGAMAASTWVGNYYLGANGAMAVSTVTEDGWTVDANGAWDGHSKAADLAAATAAVAVAEASKSQNDIDAAKALIAKLTVTADATALTARLNAIAVKLQVVSATVVNGQQILVKFSKAVDSTTATLPGSYVLTGTTNTVATVELQDDQTALLTLTSAVANTTTSTFGITINGILSATDASEVAPLYTTVLTVSDTTAPTALAVTSSTSTAYGTSAKVTFSEPVQAGFTVKVDGSVVTPTLALDKLSATLDLTNAPLDVTKTHTLEVVGVADNSGNTNSYQTLTFSVTKDTVAPVITSVAPKGDHKLLVTFSKNMGTVNLPAANFAVKDEHLSDVGGAITVSPASGDTTGTQWVVDFTAPADFYTATNVTSRNLTLVVNGTVTGSTLTDTLGNAFADTVKTVTLTKDTTAPSVVGITVQKDATGAIQTVTVQYNEAVAVGTPGTLQFVDSNGVLVVGTVGAGTVSLTDATKVVYLVGGTGAFTGTYSVTIPGGEVTDTALAPNSNKAYSGTVNFGSATTSSTFTATAASSADKTNVITVTFATPVKGGIGAGSATDPSNYSINGAPLPAGTTITLNSGAPAQTIATITLPTGTIATTDASAVFRASGIVGLNSYTLTPLVTPLQVTDNTAPVLNSAVLNSDGTISIGFSNSVSLPAITTDIIVSVNGVADTTATLVAGSGLNSGKDIVTPTKLKVDALGAYLDNDSSNTRNTGDTAVTSLTVSTAATPTAADTATNVLVGGTTITLK
jgi:hypothetical protein